MKRHDKLEYLNVKLLAIRKEKLQFGIMGTHDLIDFTKISPFKLKQYRDILVKELDCLRQISSVLQPRSVSDRGVN